MGNVWNAPEANDMGPGATGGGEPPSDLSDPMEVPRRVFEDVRDHLAGYILSGIVMTAVVFAVITGIMVLLFGFMLPGIIMEDETISLIGSLLGMAAYFFGIMGFAFLLMPLMTASMLRAIDAQRAGAQDLGAMAALSTLREDAGRIIGFNLLGVLLTFVGMLFCYVPGLIASALMMFALPMVVFERVPPVTAYQLGWKHMTQHAGWHVAVWLISMLTVGILSITFVGIIVAYPIMFAFQVFAYRTAYGDQGAMATMDA